MARRLGVTGVACDNGGDGPGQRATADRDLTHLNSVSSTDEEGLRPMFAESPESVIPPAQVCPVCCATPVTRHEWSNGTLHTDTFTDKLGHIWQVRWTVAA